MGEDEGMDGEMDGGSHMGVDRKMDGRINREGGRQI
jgi:hypothetical protein